MEIKSARVYRAGVTQSVLNAEKTTVTADHDENKLDIRFLMDSAGGGITNVLVRLDREAVDALELIIANIKQKRIAELEEKLAE